MTVTDQLSVTYDVVRTWSVTDSEVVAHGAQCAPARKRNCASVAPGPSKRRHGLVKPLFNSLCDMGDGDLHLRSRLTLLSHAFSRLKEFLKFTGGIIATVVLVLASWLVNRPLGGHHLKIGRSSVRDLSLYDVRYTGALYDEKYTYTFTAPCVSIRFCRPTSTYPSWLVFTAHELFYKSTTCDTSLTRLDATFWVFPYLFKRTAGPWISAELDGLRIRVHHSNETPYWIKRLRQNLAGALLTGDIYRLDEVKATVRFAGVSEPHIPSRGKVRTRDHARERPLSATLPAKSCSGYDASNGEASESSENDSSDSDTSDASSDDEYEDREADGSSPADHVDPPPPFLNREVDELRTTISASQLHLHNPDARIYAFRTIDAQLRRDWDTNRGSFVLVAEEGRWVRVHWPYQREWTPWWT